MSSRRRARHGQLGLFVLSVVGGALCALGVYPTGLWPLGIVGLALFYGASNATSNRGRLLAGLVFGVAYFGGALGFIAQFSLVGFAIAVLFEAALLALAALVAPPSVLRPLSFPAALALVTWIASICPFGGVPIGSLALGQADGPIAAVARLGGPILVVAVTSAIGATFADALLGLFPNNTRSVSDPTNRLGGWTFSFAVVVALLVGAVVAPNGGSQLRTLRVEAIQGGGPRGLLQLEVPATDAFVRSFDESVVQNPPPLILWPEDTVPLASKLKQGTPGALIASLARVLDTTIVAGATSPVGTKAFLNEVVAWAPSGTVEGRVEKIHRVPFGEYVPLRSILRHLVDLADVPRDAVPGTRPEVLTVDGTRFGLLISYDLFFSSDPRVEVRSGAHAILAPTNTASYSSSQVPAEELDATRLDAISVGRDIVQAATIGYSGFVGPDGAVRDATPLGKAAAIRGTIALRSGLTVYARFGDLPTLLVSGSVVAVGLVESIRRRRKDARRPDESA